MNVQIIGAGSSGCHMAKACFTESYHVSVSDTDPDAKDRFYNLYRTRYNKEYGGDWGLNEADIYIISTPPDTHYPIYQTIPKDKQIIIEKPLCLPNEINEFENVSVNYNHLYAPEYLSLLEMEKPDEIEVSWQESSNYIMAAHPWLRLEDSYLADYKRGGGSAYEHSHGLAAALGLFPDVTRDEISHLRADKRYEGKYDKYMKIRFLCRGVLVTVITDFVQAPAKKKIVLTHSGTRTISDLGLPNTSREDQFLLGLQGALKPNNSLNIAKLCMEIISECHRSS